MRPHDVRSRLVRRAGKNNIFIDDSLADRLAAYYELLARWNRKINLTSLDNLDEAIDRLLLEPLVAARFLPASANLLDGCRIRRRFSRDSPQARRSTAEADDGGVKGEEISVSARSDPASRPD